MHFSRQFKALGRIAAVFAGAWTLVGTGLSMLAGGPFVPSLLTFGVMAGAVGGISGITTGLVLARAESGRTVEELATWRASLWGFLGGFGPAGLLAAIAVVLPTPDVIGPLLVLGTVSGGVVAGLSGSLSVAAKRAEIAAADDQPTLPAAS